MPFLHSFSDDADSSTDHFVCCDCLLKGVLYPYIRVRQSPRCQCSIGGYFMNHSMTGVRQRSCYHTSFLLALSLVFVTVNSLAVLPIYHCQREHHHRKYFTSSSTDHPLHLDCCLLLLCVVSTPHGTTSMLWVFLFGSTMSHAYISRPLSVLYYTCRLRFFDAGD